MITLARARTALASGVARAAVSTLAPTSTSTSLSTRARARPTSASSLALAIADVHRGALGAVGARRRAFATASGAGDDKKKPADEEKKPQDASASASASANASAEADASPSPLSRLREAGERAAASVREALSSAFQRDETSWRDAARNLFGLKPETADKPAGQAPSAAQGAGAAAKAEKGTENKGEGQGEGEAASPLSPEEEARKWAEQNARPTINLDEEKIKALGGKIQELEAEREAAQASGDMARFKELNAQIRATRREIEELVKRVNTTSVVRVEERKGAWEQFSETLKETPLIKGIFGLGQSKAAKRLTDAAEDAREAWETSQHPLVYRVSSLVDSMFAETEMGEAIREIRKLDSGFTMETFLREMEESLIPTVLGAFLRADLGTLKEHCGEASFAALKSAVDERRRAGRVMDTNILNIQHTQVVAAKVVEKMGPLVVVQFMAQQIDVLYDTKGAVAEGSDDLVAAVFYAFAMTRERDEASGVLKWVIKEFAIVGQRPWT